MDVGGGGVCVAISTPFVTFNVSLVTHQPPPFNAITQSISDRTFVFLHYHVPRAQFLRSVLPIHLFTYQTNVQVRSSHLLYHDSHLEIKCGQMIIYYGINNETNLKSFVSIFFENVLRKHFNRCILHV